MSNRKKSRPPSGLSYGGVLRPSARNRRRASIYTRQRRRRHHTLVTIVSMALLAMAGIAVAGAVSSNGNTVADSRAAAPEPTAAPVSTPATHAPSATATPTSSATRSATPAPQARPTAGTNTKTHPAAAPRTAKPSPSPTTTPCGSATDRVSQARARLAHPGALAPVSTVTAGPRSGTLGTADFASKTVTLYVRSCADEPTLQLAVVWMYEAGQLVDVDGWDSATRDRWRQLRRSSSLVSSTQIRQDVASVFAYWQTGTTRWWQSPVPPPSPSQLSSLAPYLHIS